MRTHSSNPGSMRPPPSPTGWAKANEPGGHSDKRLQYALYNIANWSLRFDVCILAVTVLHIPAAAARWSTPMQDSVAGYATRLRRFN